MDRPRIVVHSVASVDGRVTLGQDVLLGFDQEPRWEALAGGGEEAEETLRWLEFLYRPQAFLEGSGTFVREKDTPAPLPPYSSESEALKGDYLPEDVVHPEGGRRGWFVAVDGRGRVRNWMKEFPGWDGWHSLILVNRSTPVEYLASLRQEKIPYLVSGEERVDLHDALGKLHTLLGIERMVSTAGGRLNGALLRAGLVDEISILFFPAVIGGFTTPALFDSPVLKNEEWPTRLELISAQVQAGGKIWLRYEVRSS